MATSSVLAEKRRRALATTKKWVRPVRGYPAGTPFGAKGSLWSSGYHTGLDFPAPTGTPVYAAAAGRVTSRGPAGAYGNRVVVTHSPGLETWYCHLSKIEAILTIGSGAQVAAGAKLGEVGETGNTTGPHLHFEVRVNGVAKDPAPYLSGAVDAPASTSYDNGAQPAGATTNPAIVPSGNTTQAASLDAGLGVELRRFAIVMAVVTGGIALIAVGVAKGTENTRSRA